MLNLSSQLDPSWQKILDESELKALLAPVDQFLEQEFALKKQICPPFDDLLNAFKLCPFESLKVVIIGQDPYHGTDQAHGLSFSVKKGMKPPPSLVNIYKELKTDLNIKTPRHGDLSSWATQGVLLLNNVLSVEAHKAGSHQKQGWEEFTDKVIEVINQKKSHVVFILWGSPAQKKAARVDSQKHLVIKSPHPSPLSSYRGFFGSRPFSKTNQYLSEHQLDVINWDLN
jgi:uracil-DNA glycosylase